MPAVIDLDICKLANSVYEARCEGAPETATVHQSISDALLYYGTDVPEGFARYVNISYGGISLGTQPISRLATHAEAMAHELVELSVEVQYAARELG